MTAKTSVDNTSPSAAVLARTVVRAALKASLATLDRSSGHPYASLVLVAADPDGTPLILLSKLALHTQNLAAEPRASLLFDGTEGAADPLSGARVTLIGTAIPATSVTARRRFLARHPSAEMYADFADFAFFELSVERAHLVGGFGRIVALASADVATVTADAAALIEAEPALLESLGTAHGAALARLAGRPAAPDQPWRVSGVDPEGLDLVSGPLSARITFNSRATTPAAVLEFITRSQG